MPRMGPAEFMLLGGEQQKSNINVLNLIVADMADYGLGVFSFLYRHNHFPLAMRR